MRRGAASCRAVLGSCSAAAARAAAPVSSPRSRHGWPSAPRRCDPSEVGPPSGWSPVARMSGRRPRRSSPCPRPPVRRADVRPIGRADVRCPRRPVSTRPVSTRPAPSRCPDGRALRCPRLCRRAVRTALDPGVARCRGPSRLGATGSTCRRGPRAAWSPARIGPDGKGWCWRWPCVARTRVDGRPGPPHRTRHEAAAPPWRAWPTSDAGPAARVPAGWLGAREEPAAHQSPAGASWAGRRRGARPWGWTREVVTTLLWSLGG